MMKVATCGNYQMSLLLKNFLKGTNIDVTNFIADQTELQRGGGR